MSLSRGHRVHARGGHQARLLLATAFSSGLCTCRCRMSANAAARPSPSYALVLSWPRRAAVPHAGPGQCLGGRCLINVVLFSPSNPATVESLAIFPASSHACPCWDLVAPLAYRRALTPCDGLRLALFRCRRHCLPEGAVPSWLLATAPSEPHRELVLAYLSRPRPGLARSSIAIAICLDQ